jgi:hypothetical protein
MSGYDVKGLRTRSVIFLRVIFAKTRNFSKYHSAYRTHRAGFVSACMCLTNYTFSMPHISFLHSVKDDTFYIF